MEYNMYLMDNSSIKKVEYKIPLFLKKKLKIQVKKRKKNQMSSKETPSGVTTKSIVRYSNAL